MATRANFLIEQADGTFKGYYNHWDGYPGSGLGECLLIAELAGCMKEFIQCYKDKEADGYSYETRCGSIEEAVAEFMRSDREWMYIKTFASGWLVFERRWFGNGERELIRHEVTLLELVRKDYRRFFKNDDFQVDPKEIEQAMKLARA